MELRDRRLVAELTARYGDVIHLRDADAAGVSRAVLRRAADRGELTRVAKAAFVNTGLLAQADPWQAFRLRSIGFSRCMHPEAHLAGWAAAAVLQLPLGDAPPALPAALRPGDAHLGPNRTNFGRIRWGYLPPSHRTSRGRVRTVDGAFAAVDVARHETAREGLIVADAVLHRGVPREILGRLVEAMPHYPGIETARWVVEHAEPRTESPLESLGRLAFLQEGLAPPLANVWVSDGRVRRRVDFLLPDDGVVIEGDGALKYDNRPDASTLVDDEKERERWLRNLRFEMVRYNWAIGRYRPEELIWRTRQAAYRRTGPLPTCWSLDPNGPFTGAVALPAAAATPWWATA